MLLFTVSTAVGQIAVDDPEIRKREMDRAAMDATEIFIKIFYVSATT